MARDNRSDSSCERTEEERERAREERERRRLEKTGGVKSPPPIEDRPVPPLPPPSAEMPSEVSIPPDGQVAEDYPAPESLVEDHLPELLEEEPVAVEEVSPGLSLPLPASSVDPVREVRPHKQRAAPAKPSMPHVHRPHLHRPRVSSRRTGAARTGAVLALVVVLAAIAVGVVLLVRHPKSTKPAPVPAIVKVLIPEGYTRLQIAALAHADGLRGSYLTASKKSTELSPVHYGAPAGTPNLEGFLFPATYEMYVGAPVTQLVSEQLSAFRENFGGGEIHRAKVLGVTPYELLIVASIIEREVDVPHDRSLVAAVIYNRLRLNMTLGVDSTLRYALHDFTHPLTETELSSDSPYNTRIHKGLPPTPISNPGAAAIAAAARPAKVSYLYYVAGTDGCGEQVFSTSYAEFEKNAAAYREALSKNGGHVPRCKKG